jgi:hypothetical protein
LTKIRLFFSLAIFYLLIIAYAWAGISSLYKAKGLSKRLNEIQESQSLIAVLALKNTTNSLGAGEICRNLLISQLVQQGFKVLEPANADRIYIEQGIKLQGEATEEILKILDQRYGVKIVLVGAVDRFEMEKGEKGLFPSIEIRLRALDIETKGIIWKATWQGKGNDYSLAFDLGLVRTLDKLAAYAAQELLKSLK